MKEVAARLVSEEVTGDAAKVGAIRPLVLMSLKTSPDTIIAVIKVVISRWGRMTYSGTLLKLL
ncbi:MAG TPA: hypothetical protein VHV10_09670 [Ktedonobacteraceae bacterium]|jgi:hypothetical protein|nr:hypothetical protein [Ktedonobacteraceae bacterium]